MVQLSLAPPAIVKYLPRQSGADNEGIGSTRFGERFLLKADPAVCLAEFVGAALCRACGIPVPEPVVVSFRKKDVFGSRLESGVILPQTQMDLVAQLKNCENTTIFSAILALDLAVGNNDRHWHNWLPQVQHDGRFFMRAVDFSRGWPTVHPPRPFEALRGENTELVWREWASLGIRYDVDSAMHVCSTIETLSAEWLGSLFMQLPADWMITANGPDLINWWNENWTLRVQKVKNFLESGAWK